MNMDVVCYVHCESAEMRVNGEPASLLETAPNEWRVIVCSGLPIYVTISLLCVIVYVQCLQT